MSRPSVDRDFFFGMVALEMNLIECAELIDTMQEWVQDPSRPLSNVLVARNQLTDDETTVVERVVTRELGDKDDILDADHSQFGPDDLDIGQIVAADPPRVRYRVLSAHARGGLGEVFLAEDTELHRRVAQGNSSKARREPGTAGAVRCRGRDHRPARTSRGGSGLWAGNAS